MAAVVRRHSDLRTRLGGVRGFELVPRTYTNSGGMTWVYNIMESVVDGVRLGDQACIEISVEYIEDQVMGSCTGYIRERMARTLRHAQLSSSQRDRLARVFLFQLASGCLYKEFKEYIRLFKVIGVDEYRASIERFSTSPKAYIRRAAGRLLGSVSCLKPDVDPRAGIRTT